MPTKIFNKSELDISDDSVQNSKKYPSATLQATTVHHFPLVSARSVAHSNKLNIHANDIYVSLIEDDVSINLLLYTHLIKPQVPTAENNSIKARALNTQGMLLCCSSSNVTSLHLVIYL